MPTPGKSSDALLGRLPAAPQIPSVLADIYYVASSAEPLYNYMYEPPDGSPQHNCNYDLHSARISHARGLSIAPSVHAAGSPLWVAASKLGYLHDEQEAARMYYEGCADLACAATGGKRT